MNKNRNQVLYLYIASFSGTLLGVIASIVNTRSLVSEFYGDVRYVQNIINFMASLLLFGYFFSGSRLLALSNDETKSRSIRGVMVIILLISVAILMFGIVVNAFVHLTTPTISKLFLISLPVCAFPLLNNYVNITAQGDNHIGRLAVARLIPVGLYIPIAYFVYTNYGATSTRMMLLQWGIYTIVLSFIVLLTRPSFNNVKEVFQELNDENKRYGIQLYYGSLAMLATNYIGGVTLGAFNSDNTNVGFYTLALTVTGPLAMLPGIVGTTYFKKFASMSKIPSNVLKVTLLLTLLACFLFIIMIQPLVKFLYSESYSMVGVYSSWMAVGFCIHGIGDMLNRYLGSHGLGKPIRNSSYVCGLFRVIGFTLLVYMWDINGAITTTVLSSLVYTSIMIYYYCKAVNHGI